MKVDVFSIHGPDGYAYRRGDHIAEALSAGLARHGVQHTVRRDFDGQRSGDVALAYGWIHGPILRRYENFAFYDLGYWNRRPPGAPQDGAHRLAINSWDTAEYMPRSMPGDRFEAARIDLRPWTRAASDVALIAGMSAKSARVHGYGLGDWEAMAAATVAGAGWRPVQRPKSPKRSVAIEPIERALMNCGLLVTHHSNCAVDAVIAGVPCWAAHGVGRLISPAQCPPVASPLMLTTAQRRAFLADVAYAQWTVAEMRSGAAWDFVRGIYENSVQGRSAQSG